MDLAITSFALYFGIYLTVQALEWGVGQYVQKHQTTSQAWRYVWLGLNILAKTIGIVGLIYLVLIAILLIYNLVTQ